jgi:RNA polymerase sigma-70 factor, ECF subfamily
LVDAQEIVWVDELTDDDLIRMYRDGDADAFDALFDRHHASAYGFARSILGRLDGAEDVLQETFLAVARTARTYTPRGRFRPWLLRIVRNRCLNRIQAERARREALMQSSLCMREPPSHQVDPEAQMKFDEHAEVVRRAVTGLPDRQREAIALYAFERMAYREIAEVMGMPINTVKTLIYRARANLARSLKPEPEESSREL